VAETARGRQYPTLTLEFPEIPQKAAGNSDSNPSERYTYRN